MTREHIEQLLRGTGSWDCASATKKAPFLRDMERLEPAGVTVEYCWRFYSMGYETANSMVRSKYHAN